MALPSLPETAAAVDRVTPFLLDAALRGVVILSLTALAALAARRASAATRHWIWLLGFSGMLLLPILSTVLPGWRVLPRLNFSSTAPRTSASIITPPADFPEFAAPQPAPAAKVDSPAIATAATPTADPVAAAPIAAVSAAAPAQSLIESPSPVDLTPTARHAALPRTFWLTIIWLAGCMILLCQVSLGYLSLWFLRRHCAPITQGTWPDLLNDLKQTLHLRRRVQLLHSPHRTMPMTWGLWHTQILLPVDCASWPLEQRRAVLLHELGHAHRYDCLTQLLAQITCALYWCNPLVWVAWRRMQIERERACDDLVLNTGAKASTYAQHLLQSASALVPSRFVSAAVAMARPSTLEERMRAILDTRRNRRAIGRRVALGTILLLIACVVPMATLKAQDIPLRQLAAAPPLPTPPAAQPPAAPTPSARGALPQPTDAPPVPPARGARGGARGGIAGGIGGVAPPRATPLEGPTSEMDATIYDVRLPVEQIGKLDVAALTRASGTAGDFEKALAALGPTVPLYRINQTVRIAGESMRMGTSMPYITSSRTNDNGQIFNSVTYRDTGASFELIGKVTGPGSIELDMQMQLSTMSEGTVLINNNVKAPIFRSVIMSHKGPVEVDKAFVIVGIDADHVDPAGKATAFIARVRLGAPRGAPGGGASPVPAAAPPTPASGPRSDARRGGAPSGEAPAAAPVNAVREGLVSDMNAVIYNVRLPVDQIGRLDMDALTKAASNPADFERALIALGTTVRLHRVNQSVRLAGETVYITQSTPFVTSSQVTRTGEAINATQNRPTGAIFDVAGKATATGLMDLDMRIELEAMREGSVAISENLKAPIFQQAQMSHKGPVEVDKPFVIVGVDADHLDPEGKAAAYIAIVTMGAPQAALPGGPDSAPRVPAEPPLQLGGRGPARAGGRVAPVPPRPLPTLGEGPTGMLDATIYDVRLPMDRIGQLDAGALTRAAANAADFEKALAALGPAVVLYRANQSVRLLGDHVMLGATTPYITSSQEVVGGKTINSVTYRGTGATFDLYGKVTTPGALDMGMAINVSTLSEGTLLVTNGVKAPIFRNAQLSHNGTVEAGKAFVVLNIDADHVDQAGKAVAIIARVIVGAPQGVATPVQGR